MATPAVVGVRLVAGTANRVHRWLVENQICTRFGPAADGAANRVRGWLVESQICTRFGPAVSLALKTGRLGVGVSAGG